MPTECTKLDWRKIHGPCTFCGEKHETMVHDEWENKWICLPCMEEHAVELDTRH